MLTKRDRLKARLRVLNRNLEKVQKSSIQLELDDLIELDEREHKLVDAIAELLDYDGSVIEADLAYISTYLLWAMRDNHDKIYRVKALIHLLETVIKTAELNNELNVGFEIGEITAAMQSRAEQQKIVEYPVKEFAKLIGVHEHTVRKRFKDGVLKGRRDSKGIFIAASELKKYIQD